MQNQLKNQQPEHQASIAGEENGVVARRAAWAFIDPRPLIREALRCLLETAGSPFVIAAASSRDLLARVAGTDLSIELIMLYGADGPANREQFLRECAVLRKGIAGVPVVVLSDRVNLDEIGHAIRAGARGYIATTFSCPTALRALRHVEAGSVYVPEEALSGLFESAHASEQGKDPQKARRTWKFTPRQLQVLSLLREGKPNKIIAHELAMQESTVKVHVREIMKRLKVTNRTEAAFRAGQMLMDPESRDATNGRSG